VSITHRRRSPRFEDLESGYLSPRFGGLPVLCGSTRIVGLFGLPRCFSPRLATIVTK